MQEIPHTINIYETKEAFICLCRFRTWRSFLDCCWETKTGRALPIICRPTGLVSSLWS